MSLLATGFLGGGLEPFTVSSAIPFKRERGHELIGVASSQMVT